MNTCSTSTSARFVYDSKEGWSGDGGATMNFRGNAFSFGLVSNSDTTIDRYAGVRARFERKHLGTDRLRIRFDFTSYHDEWNAATLNAAPLSDIYRWRESFSPMATVVIADPLELDFGVTFDRFRVPFAIPGPAEGEGSAAARTESSNAVVSTLRYHQRWGSEHDVQSQELNASYSIASATDLLDTDRNFTRQLAKAHYKYRHAHNTWNSDFCPAESVATRRCMTASCWAIRPHCADGTSSIWIRWVDRTWRTGPSITGIVFCRFSMTRARFGTGRPKRNNRSEWDSKRKDFNWPWLSRCARAGPIRFFTQG